MREARQEHRALAGRIGAADDEHALVLVVGGLGDGGAVVYRGPDQSFDAGYVELAHPHAGGDQ